MLIHVDLARLEKHLRILEQQLAQERQNAELLDQWRACAAGDPNTDSALIDRQIRFMERQIQNTHNKHLFLEEMAELLRHTNYKMGEKASSAEDALKRMK